MATVQVEGIEGLKSLLGEQIGPSEWREVTQEDINAFADLSGDHQWIHTDVERARNESPFGTTVAHGNLTLSMIDGMRLELLSSSGFKLGVNYGWNRVRFPAPVPAGSRIRATAEAGLCSGLGGPSPPRVAPPYLTVSVPSMPASRWPGTVQKNV